MSTVPTVTISGVDVTAEIASKSLRWQLNTLDLRLVDPAVVPTLGAGVAVDTPAWAGSVTNVKTASDERGTILWAEVTATNDDAPVAAAAPFGLSDAPDGSTTYGYRGLVVTRTRQTAGDEIRASLETLVEGLVPGMTVELTSALEGFAAEEFTIDAMSVGWEREDAAVYGLELGDPMVTLSAWVRSEANAEVLPITSTKITDGSVTTPKLAANAVTAAKLFVGSASNLIDNPGFEVVGTIRTDGDVPGWTLVPRTPGVILIDNTAGGFAPAEGAQYLVIQNGSATVDAAAMQGPFAVSGGELISFSARGQGLGSTGHLQFFLECLDAAQALIGYVVGTDFSVGNSAGWVQASEALTPLANTRFVRIGVQNHGAVNTYLGVDDVLVMRSLDGINAATGNVRVDSSGIAVTNGKITVTNASSTVVIDGTSNMFKIAATGTLQTAGFTNSAGWSTTATVDLSTGFTSRTSFLAFHGGSSAAWVSPSLTANMLVANGGWIQHTFDVVLSIVNTNQTRVRVTTTTSMTSGSTAAIDYRYYVLKESAI